MQGAIYSHDIDTDTFPSYTLFKNNEYKYAFSLDSAIMRAESLGSSTLLNYAVHNFTDESLYQI